MAFVRKFFRVLKKLFKRRKPRRRKLKSRPLRRVSRRKAVLGRRRKAVKAPSARRRPLPVPRAGKKPVPAKKDKGSAVRPLKPLKAAPKPVEPILVPAGEITHYFSKIMVCVVKVTGTSLNVGERINIRGAHTDFIQKVGSLQIESVDVRTARKGQLVGLKTDQVCRVGDQVFKVFPGRV